MAYLWAMANGEILEAEYNRTTDSLNNEQVRNELLNAFQQFGHTATCEPVSDEMGEVYSVVLDGAVDAPIYVCAKGTTPGGRSNLNDEQRIQQKSKYINYAFRMSQQDKPAILLGVYKREGQVVFCAWALKASTASPETPISKQIKINSIAEAMKCGFVQQDKGSGEFACAFRREFMFFYLNNYKWFHGRPAAELTENGTQLPNATPAGNRIGENVLLYGVPGCGKSYTIKTQYCDDEQYMERVVFHPDYTYSDFVGQIMPTNVDGHISYPFIPGPFTRILRKAESDHDHEYFLVIEEINRGNAPAIFGEVFQLLDRRNGVSEYGISNADIAREVYDDPEAMVRIPANLFILATMNTADQNVFTLDTAFKRRWAMKSIRNDIGGCEYGGTLICGSTISWRMFAETINALIIDLGQGSLSSEDNRLGAYFVREEELNSPTAFAEKVLMYLWNDAFKYDHSRVFKPEYKTLEDLIDGFMTIQFGVFQDNIGFLQPNVVAPMPQEDAHRDDEGEV